MNPIWGLTRNQMINAANQISNRIGRKLLPEELCELMLIGNGITDKKTEDIVPRVVQGYFSRRCIQKQTGKSMETRKLMIMGQPFISIDDYLQEQIVRDSSAQQTDYISSSPPPSPTASEIASLIAASATGSTQNSTSSSSPTSQTQPTVIHNHYYYPNTTTSSSSTSNSNFNNTHQSTFKGRRTREPIKYNAPKLSNRPFRN